MEALSLYKAHQMPTVTENVSRREGTKGKLTCASARQVLFMLLFFVGVGVPLFLEGGSLF